MSETLPADVTTPPRAPSDGFARHSFGGRLARFGFRKLRGAARRLWYALQFWTRVSRNLVHRLLGLSDRKRWANLENYEPWWDARTIKLAALVPPGSRVIEFGAGRRQLEKYLDPTCTYIPSDLEDRGPGTFVCNLNHRPLPDLAPLGVNAAVFGGVLEYIHDVESLTAWLALHVSLCVVSYACVSKDEGWFRSLRSRWSRFYYGYMNSYDEDAIVALFGAAGFRCIARDPWTSQRVFLFVNARLAAQP
jgi:hypothetical protein